MKNIQVFECSSNSNSKFKMFKTDQNFQNSPKQKSNPLKSSSTSHKIPQLSHHSLNCSILPLQKFQDISRLSPHLGKNNFLMRLFTFHSHSFHVRVEEEVITHKTVRTIILRNFQTSSCSISHPPRFYITGAKTHKAQATISF
jgi:hypothetical protein